MTNKTVYLAGPIAGCTEAEAKDWREVVSGQLAYANITGISPLRGETPTNGRFDAEDFCPKTARAIGAKNEFDVRNCDMVLAYFPLNANSGQPLSLGTIVEMGWAKAMNKPVILVTQDRYLTSHPLIQHCASWHLETLQGALDVLATVLGDYSK